MTTHRDYRRTEQTLQKYNDAGKETFSSTFFIYKILRTKLATRNSRLKKNKSIWEILCLEDHGNHQYCCEMCCSDGQHLPFSSQTSEMIIDILKEPEKAGLSVYTKTDLQEIKEKKKK